MRFEDGAPAQIELAFAPDDDAYAATTEAECRLERAAEAAGAGTRLPAGLVTARVALRRAQLDFRGHAVALDEAQQLGALLHELGHALGYQGHATQGDTVMLRTVERVRDVGRHVLGGGAFHDDTLAALYRVPSGSVVARMPLAPGKSEPVDRLAGLSAREGDGSLWLRIGDRAGRISALTPPDQVFQVYLRGLPDALRDPARLLLIPDPELAAR